MSTDAVFFDFAGTLFSDRALRDVHLAQLQFVADAVGVEATDVELRAAYRGGMGVAYRKVAARPSYQHRELFGTAFAAMAALLGGELDQTQVDHAVDRQYRATIKAVELRPDCIETLGQLRELGLHVQIVSNIDIEQIEGLVSRLQLAAVLDGWTSSEEAASCKPDPGIYLYALDKAGCRPEDVLFVGDSLVHDVEGPQSMGMRTALLVDNPAAAPDSSADFAIASLGEVLTIIEMEPVA